MSISQVSQPGVLRNRKTQLARCGGCENAHLLESSKLEIRMFSGVGGAGDARSEWREVFGLSCAATTWRVALTKIATFGLH